MKFLSIPGHNNTEVIKMAKNQTRTIQDHNNFMKKLKIEVATDLNLLGNIKENNDHYRGDVSCRDNGHQGGPIGGEMVKRMINYSKQNLS
jgi:hypothetical protein